MAQYTIDDIEILRQKSGISYEEAVNLLEYHNGSLARALVDLEKNGKLNTGKREPAKKQSANIFNRLYRLRLRVSRGDVTIVNLSCLFVILACLLSFWTVLIGLLLAVIFGYRIRVDRRSVEFDGADLEDVVKKAGDNLRKTVTSFTQEFESKTKKAEDDSYYRSEPEPRSEPAPSGTTPVNVPFSDGGNVRVSDDDEGFHEADVE